MQCASNARWRANARAWGTEIALNINAAAATASHQGEQTIMYLSAMHDRGLAGSCSVGLKLVSMHLKPSAGHVCAVSLQQLATRCATRQITVVSAACARSLQWAATSTTPCVMAEKPVSTTPGACALVAASCQTLLCFFTAACLKGCHRGGI